MASLQFNYELFGKCTIDFRILFVDKVSASKKSTADRQRDLRHLERNWPDDVEVTRVN